MQGLARRPRPELNKGDMFATVSMDLFSFPSGHASRVAMLCVLIFLGLPKDTLSLLSRFAFLVWQLSIAGSRVLLGRHYISDVAVGLLVGYLEGLFVLRTGPSEEVCKNWLFVSN